MAFTESAENLAYVPALYDVDNDWLGESQTADVTWVYEQDLPRALDMLADRRATLDGPTWANTLVPFLTGLFVRGPGFESKFKDRFANHRNNVREAAARSAPAARLIEYQYLLAPVMAAEWYVVHFPANVELVTSDTGYAGMRTDMGDGYVIPVGPRAAVALIPTPLRKILSRAGKSWIAPLRRVFYGQEDADKINAAMGACARREVYGSSESIVDLASKTLRMASELGPGAFELSTPLDLACHVYDYFRVVSALQGAAVDENGIVAIDWGEVAKVWAGQVAVELLFPKLTAGGVLVESSSISMDLTRGWVIRRRRIQNGLPVRSATGLLDLKSILADPEKFTNPTAWASEGDTARATPGPLTKNLRLSKRKSENKRKR